MGKRFYEFIKTAGVLGGGSVLLAVICFAITVTEHIRVHNVSASVFGLLTIVFFCFGAFQAWNQERDARLTVEQKYFDERPLLGMNIHGPTGPQAWASAASNSNSCWFWLQQLGGRTAMSICFDPIRSKGGRFNLHFDAVPFLEPPRPTSLKYHTQENGVIQLSAHDLEKIGDIEFALLRMFLGDGSSELIQLQYPLTVRFKDRGNDEQTHVFNLIFDKTTFAFLPNTA